MISQSMNPITSHVLVCFTIYLSIWHLTDYKTGLRLLVYVLYVCAYVSVRTLTVALLDRFSPKLAQT